MRYGATSDTAEILRRYTSHVINLQNYLYILNAVSCPYVTYVRNAGRGQLSSEGRHNENDVTMTMAGLCRYGDWRDVAATGCNGLTLIFTHTISSCL